MSLFALAPPTGGTSYGEPLPKSEVAEAPAATAFAAGATTIILAIASYELINPMQTLKIDLAEVMDAMYAHYEDVTSGLPPFPEQGLRDAVVGHIRKSTPRTIRMLGAITNVNGDFDGRRLVAMCQRAVASPRALRDLFAA